jgi:hypothetical protein
VGEAVLLIADLGGTVGDPHETDLRTVKPTHHRRPAHHSKVRRRGRPGKAKHAHAR